MQDVPVLSTGSQLPDMRRRIELSLVVEQAAAAAPTAAARKAKTMRERCRIFPSCRKRCNGSKRQKVPCYTVWQNLGSLPCTAPFSH